MNRGNTIGSRIEFLRKKSKLTQAELAKEMSVKRETVVQWESNTRDLKTAATVKLAEFFDVSADYILGLTSDIKGDPNVMAVEKRLGLSAMSQENVTNSSLAETQLINFLLCNDDFYSILSRLNSYAVAEWRSDAARHIIDDHLKHGKVDAMLLANEHELLPAETIKRINLLDISEIIKTIAEKWTENRERYLSDISYSRLREGEEVESDG